MNQPEKKSEITQIHISRRGLSSVSLLVCSNCMFHWNEWSITFLLCHIISPPLSSFYYSNYFFLRSTYTNKTLTHQHRIQCNHICQYVSGVGHSHMSDTRTHIQSEILSDCSFVYYFVLIISTIMIFFSASSLYINTHKWFYKVIL
jgi:hypothetical protein